MSKIPIEARTAVWARQWGLCFRCLMPGSQVHHRRRRGVIDVHTHCPCNLVLLDADCHRWVHAHPEQAQEDRLILLTTVALPYEHALHGFDGWWANDCEGHTLALSGTQ